MKIFNY